jgi:hypothetical protein
VSIVQGNAMKYFPGFLALVTLTCLSDAAFAQQHPDISGLWTRGGAAETPFRPPPSGPGPVTTLRLPGQSVPRLAGDYNAPILQPWAAEVVRRQSDLVRAGKTAVGAPQETCWPMGVPYILELNFHTQIIDDGKQIVFTASQGGHGTRVYLRDVAGGKSRALTPDDLKFTEAACRLTTLALLKLNSVLGVTGLFDNTGRLERKVRSMNRFKMSF